MSLLPKELVRKRYWSKKYPLCLKGVKQLNNTFNNNKHEIHASTSTSSIRLSTSLTRNLNNVSLSSSASNAELGNSGDDEDTNKSCNNLPADILVLFARTDREKEEWFKLFKKSAAKTLLDSMHYLKLNKIKANVRASISSTTSLVHTPTNQTVAGLTEVPAENDETSVVASAEMPSSESNAQIQAKNSSLLQNSSITFMNTFLIRLFADFFTHKQWIDLIQTKIQNKLSKIKVPNFMEELRITGIDLGSVVPLIKQTSEPWYDEKGLWVHLEIDYSGGFTMSLATKLNLMKFRTKSSLNLQTLNNSPTSSGSNSATFSFKNNRDSCDDASISMISSSPRTANDPNALPNESSSSASLNNSDSFDQQASNASNSPINTSANGYLLSKNLDDKHIRRHKNRAIVDSNEEESPESSGDEYVHTGFKNDEENKLVET